MIVDYTKKLSVQKKQLFDSLTPITPVKKKPLIPLKSMRGYLEEYNRIQLKESCLTAIQRAYIVNVIHNQVRAGKITLNIKG